MLKIAKEELEKLIEKAKEGLKNAYAPRSNFPTGAAVLTDKGNVYQGCNVESVISGMGTCAERCAIDNAIANGEYCFKAIIVITKLENPVKPCGMCLHYINEFAQVANHDIAIIMAGSGGKISKSSVFKMLPEAFGPRDLGLNLKKYKC
ncbi:cytidine deaminase [Candidatus Pacearchaeota archaeon]|nr:cytidine deaminase [Candidatus Pacearchaeota archaeon]